VTKEQALEGHLTYIAEKKFGEQAVLDFAEKHPEMDITICEHSSHLARPPPANSCVVCPPWIFGPFAPGFEHIVPTPDFAAFSTNIFVYHLLRADNTSYRYSPGVLDVRDVARAHISGLHPLTPNHPKRVPIVSPYDADFRDAIRYISEAHPELRERLADPSTVPAWPRYKLPVDLKPVEEAYGIEHGSYKTWKETILDAVDRFLDLEKLWKSKGLEFEVPRTWA
jgi:nucleoside-diphosphate-sugar epimerase